MTCLVRIAVQGDTGRRAYSEDGMVHAYGMHLRENEVLAECDFDEDGTPNFDGRGPFKRYVPWV